MIGRPNCFGDHKLVERFFRKVRFAEHRIESPLFLSRLYVAQSVMLFVHTAYSVNVKTIKTLSRLQNISSSIRIPKQPNSVEH